MKRREDIRADSGFTLIEILMSVAISAIVLTALIGVFSSQQRTYAQQTDLAKSQASARSALYQMSRDIRMAGYTGIPLGIDKLAETGTYAVLSVVSGAPDEPADSTGEVIEIWGNFKRQTTTLTEDYNSGTSLKVDDVSLFNRSGFSKPGWVVVGMSAGSNIILERKTFSSVNPASGGGAGTITLSSALTNTYAVGGAVVAPLFRRMYYVNGSKTDPDRPGLGRPTLYVRNFDPNTAHDLELATGVSDLKFLYHSVTPVDGSTDEITIDQATITDPCSLRGVTIHLWTRSEKYRENVAPLLREFSTTLRIRNIGFDMTKCPI